MNLQVSEIRHTDTGVYEGINLDEGNTGSLMSTKKLPLVTYYIARPETQNHQSVCISIT